MVRASAMRLGRKPKLMPRQRIEALGRRDAGEPLVDIARSYAVSHSDDFQAEIAVSFGY